LKEWGATWKFFKKYPHPILAWTRFFLFAQMMKLTELSGKMPKIPAFKGHKDHKAKKGQRG